MAARIQRSGTTGARRILLNADPIATELLAKCPTRSGPLILILRSQ